MKVKLHLFPPLLFLGLSSGAGRAFFGFGGGGSINFSSRASTSSLNFCPTLPEISSPYASTRAASVTLYL